MEIAGTDATAGASVETTFEWGELRFHVLTREPPTEDQLVFIREVLVRLDRVGSFASALGYVFGRRVTLRTTRPSPDIWFDVGL